MWIGVGKAPAFTARRIVLRESPVTEMTAGIRIKTFISLMFGVGVKKPALGGLSPTW